MLLSLTVHNEDQCQQLLNYNMNIKSPIIQVVDINTIIEDCKIIVDLSQYSTTLTLPI